MTPMIDVVFLLIIFFLVSSHLAKQENSVQLDLPTADSGLDDTSPVETLVVNVLASGHWQIGGVEVNEAMLPKQFRSRQQAATEPLRLKIRTDQNVTYDRLEPLLKQAALAGVGDIVFSVYDSKARP
ncbi:biopolymer transport protein ExbD [Aureliella helgolandensis]|uniref:Biopolymer transport protein ExbD n=2 Tax=Aureliella helgolandensis TaxID=2527968 RepID=A0A518GCP4_9BACT|nr:biopolymer transport protein ExbD [Aureliella helgolandensis]